MAMFFDSILVHCRLPQPDSDMLLDLRRLLPCMPSMVGSLRWKNSGFLFYFFIRVWELRRAKNERENMGESK
tara:strand:+ start:33 stop:248 length:216 start_codon:yes stop_codon:yes gene_type:complete